MKSIDVNDKEPRYKHTSNVSSNDDVLRETYSAWKLLTVLQDKSFNNFLRIVQTCIDSCEDRLRDGTLRERTECSTGSVYVVAWRHNINTPNEHMTAEVMATTCSLLY